MATKSMRCCRIGQRAVAAALDGVLVKKDVLLCVDGDAAVIAYAKKHGIEFETIIASKGEHVHEKVLHLQNVNATVSRLKKWLARFNGAASKYLPNYLVWRRQLETGKTPFCCRSLLKTTFNGDRAILIAARKA
jgi:hypothetical protein